jgi:hypothetical protein
MEFTDFDAARAGWKQGQRLCSFTKDSHHRRHAVADLLTDDQLAEFAREGFVIARVLAEKP